MQFNREMSGILGHIFFVLENDRSLTKGSEHQLKLLRINCMLYVKLRLLQDECCVSNYGTCSKLEF